MSKSIKEVVDEFSEVFGRVEFKATNETTGQVGGSRGWKESPPAGLEITGEDYIALGDLKTKLPAQGVIAGLMNLELNRYGKRNKS